MKNITQKLKSKLRARRGESIGEVLIALLIVTLALVSLATMISSSTGRILQSSRQTERYIQAENVLAAQDSGGVAGTGTVTMTMEDSDDLFRLTDACGEKIAVTFYHDSALTGPNPGTSYKVG